MTNEQMGNGRVAGRSFVVVGGTSGLGLSATRALVREGGKVVVVGRDVAKGQRVAEELGEAVRVVAGDATSGEISERAVSTAVEAFGGLHGLYHVAGGSGRRRGDGPLHEISDDGWAFTLEWNLASVFRSNRAAIGQFLKQGGGGTILNCSSVLGFSPAPKHFSTHAYAAAKAGIIGMTRSAAAYYAEANIRMNVIAPALVATPMSQRAQGDEALLDWVGKKQALDGGRIGLPEDLDGAVVWLLSDESRFVTGQVVSVDGGWTVR